MKLITALKVSVNCFMVSSFSGMWPLYSVLSLNCYILLVSAERRSGYIFYNNHELHIVKNSGQLFTVFSLNYNVLLAFSSACCTKSLIMKVCKYFGLAFIWFYVFQYIYTVQHVHLQKNLSIRYPIPSNCQPIIYFNTEKDFIFNVLLIRITIV